MTSPSDPPGEAYPADNVETVKRLFHAFSRRDMRALEEVLDEDVVFEPAPTLARPHRSYAGHAGMRQYLEDVGRTWERLEVHVQEYRDAGAYVLAFGRIYAAGGGSVADDPASFVWRVEGGKAVWGKVFRRRDEALAVAGLAE